MHLLTFSRNLALNARMYYFNKSARVWKKMFSLHISRFEERNKRFLQTYPIRSADPLLQIQGKYVQPVLPDTPKVENIAKSLEDNIFTKGFEANGTQTWIEQIDLIKDQQKKNINPTVQQYNQAMKACLASRKANKALSLFDEMRTAGVLTPNRISYQLALMALRPSRNGNKALALFAEMKWCGFPVMLENYEALLGVLAEAGMHNDAVSILQQMEFDSLRPRIKTYSLVLKAFVKDKQPDLALDFVQDLLMNDKTALTNSLFHEILECLSNLQLHAQVVELFEWAQKESRASLNVLSYMIALKAYAKEQLWHTPQPGEAMDPGSCKSVWTLLADMKSQGWLDTACYNVLVDVISESHKQKYGKFKGAHHNNMEKQERATAISEMSNIQPSLFDLLSIMNEEGYTPDEITFNIALKGCSEWEEAVKILDKMHSSSVSPTTETYNTAIHLCAKQGQWQKALELLDETKRSEGLEPNERTYNAAIIACREGFQWKKAIALLEEMSSLGLVPDTVNINTTISACAQSRCWGEAIQLLQYMRKEGLADVVSFNSAMHACNRARQGQQALKLMAELEDEGYTPDIYTFTTALVACTNIQTNQWTWKKAVKIMNQMNERNMKVNAQHYIMALKACSHGGAYQEAKALIRTMYAQKIEVNPQEKSLMHNMVLKACAVSRNPDEAIEHLQEMNRIGVDPDTFSFNVIMRCYYDQGLSDGVYQLFQIMKEKGVPRDLITYNRAISCLMSTQKNENAILAWNLFLEMVAEGIRPNGLTVLELLKSSNDGQGSEQKIYQILQEMDKHKICPTVDTYSAFFSSLPRSSDVMKALLHFGVTEGHIFQSSKLQPYMMKGAVEEVCAFQISVSPGAVSVDFLNAALKELVQYKDKLIANNSSGSTPSGLDSILWIQILGANNPKKAARYRRFRSLLLKSVQKIISNYSGDICLLEEGSEHFLLKV